MSFFLPVLHLEVPDILHFSDSLLPRRRKINKICPTFGTGCLLVLVLILLLGACLSLFSHAMPAKLCGMFTKKHDLTTGQLKIKLDCYVWCSPLERLRMVREKHRCGPEKFGLIATVVIVVK